MKIKALKNYKPEYFHIQIDNRIVSFPKRGLKLLDVDLRDERIEYSLWLERFHPIICDVTNGEYFLKYIETETIKRKQEIINKKIQNNLEIQKLETAKQKIERTLEQYKQPIKNI